MCHEAGMTHIDAQHQGALAVPAHRVEIPAEPEAAQEHEHQKHDDKRDDHADLHAGGDEHAFLVG